MKNIYNYVDGKLIESSSKKFSPVFDPSTGEQTSQVNLSNAEDLKIIIENSKNSFIIMLTNNLQYLCKYLLEVLD